MISFQSIMAGFKINDPAFFRSWLKIVLQKEGSKKPGEIQYIFCDDFYLLEINKKFLSHHTFTDIITFPTSTLTNVISGEIFISIDRINENMKFFNTSLNNELSRVVVHGLLHLIGYDDHSEPEKIIMRKKEDYYLSLQPQKKS